MAAITARAASSRVHVHTAPLNRPQRIQGLYDLDQTRTPGYSRVMGDACCDSSGLARLLEGCEPLAGTAGKGDDLLALIEVERDGVFGGGLVGAARGFENEGEVEVRVGGTGDQVGRLDERDRLTGKALRFAVFSS